MKLANYKDIVQVLQDNLTDLHLQLQAAQIPVSLNILFSVHNYEHNPSAIFYWSGCKNYTDLLHLLHTYATHHIPIIWSHPITNTQYVGERKGPKSRRDEVDKLFMFLIKCKHDLTYEGVLFLLLMPCY
jgi:hypothetical protein